MENAQTESQKIDAIVADIESQQEGEAATSTNAQDGQAQQDDPEAALAELLKVDEPAIKETTEPVYKVKLNGEEVELPASELAKGYQRQSDYTRKTQELAAQRREAEQQYEHVMQVVKVAQELAQSSDALLAAENNQQFWMDLAKNNPGKYAELREELSQRKARLAHVNSVKEQYEARRLQEAFAYGEEQFLAASPELRDPQKFAAFEQEALSYLGKHGIDRREAMMIADHRLMLVIKQAMYADKIQNQLKSVAAKKASNQSGRVQRPGTGAPIKNANNEQIGRLKSAAASGSRSDMDRLIDALGIT